jgi:hypothetical protein
MFTVQPIFFGPDQLPDRRV